MVPEAYIKAFLWFLWESFSGRESPQSLSEGSLSVPVTAFTSRCLEASNVPVVVADVAAANGMRQPSHLTIPMRSFVRRITKIR